MVEEHICCYCNEKNQYCSPVNAGKNYYCLKCIQKIEDSKMDYWKDCSFDDFLGSIPIKNRRESETPFADHIREELRKSGMDVPERKGRRKRKLK